MSRLRRELRRHRTAVEGENNGSLSSATDDSLIHPDTRKLSWIHKLVMFDLWSNDDQQVFETLGTLADIDDSDARQEVYETGGPYTVVAVLNKWYNVREIIIQGMRAISNLGANTSFRDTAFAVGAMDVVLLAMENFPDCTYVQRNACAAICRICLGNKYYAAHFVGELGGLEMLTWAMKRFPDCVSIQKWAVLTLYDFCAIEQLRQPIVRCGGVKALEHFMNKYQNTKDCQEVWTKAEKVLVDIGAINELNRVNAKRKLRGVVKMIIATHLLRMTTGNQASSSSSSSSNKKARGSSGGSSRRILRSKSERSDCGSHCTATAAPTRRPPIQRSNSGGSGCTNTTSGSTASRRQ